MTQLTFSTLKNELVQAGLLGVSTFAVILGASDNPGKAAAYGAAVGAGRAVLAQVGEWAAAYELSKKGDAKAATPPTPPA